MPTSFTFTAFSIYMPQSEILGKNVVLFIQVAGVWTPYVCALEATINHNTDYIETSVSGSGLFASYLPTKNSFTVSISGIVSINNPGNVTLADLRALQFSQTVFLMRFTREDSEGFGYMEQGSVFITSSSDTGSFDGMNTFSVDMQGTGAIVQTSSLPDRLLRENGTDYVKTESNEFILLENN